MNEIPKRKGLPLWLLAVIIPAAGAVALCCCGGVGLIAYREPGRPAMPSNAPPTTPAELGGYQGRVSNSVRGQKFERLMVNAKCQLTNHFAVRDLPDFLAVNVTTNDGGGAVVILDRHSSVASLLGDAQSHRLVMEIGPATRHTRADAVCLEIFGGREIKELPPLKRTVKVQVQAIQPWQDTGIDIPAASEITAEIAGTWAKGKAVCGEGGFSAADAPEPKSVRQVREELERVRAEPMPDFSFPPRPDPSLTGPAKTKATKEYNEKARMAMQQQKTWQEEQYRRTVVCGATLKKEKDRANELLPLRGARVMSLIAKLGQDATPRRLLPRLPPSPQSGRLFLQPNDTDLQENSGSLDVILTIITPQQ